MKKSVHMTQQRKWVYERVREATDHPDASAVMDRLRQDGHKLAYATVYNSLRYLTEVGLIQELNIGSGAVSYDARLEPHQHVVCTVCRRVDEVFGLETTHYGETVQHETGYQVEHVNVVIRGICPQCAAKTSPGTK